MILLSSTPSKVWKPKYPMFDRALLRNGPSGPSGVEGRTLPSQWGCLMVEAIRFAPDLIGLCRLTHTPQRPGRLKISSRRTRQAMDPIIRNPAMYRLAGYLRGKFRFL